jgi:hypothetical protein
MEIELKTALNNSDNFHIINNNNDDCNKLNNQMGYTGMHCIGSIVVIKHNTLKLSRNHF